MLTDQVEFETLERIRPPVPRLPLDIKEDSLSKRLRKFDNAEITHVPPSYIGLYLTTNEDNVDRIATHLKLHPKVQGGCHIGFSGWHNLDIMALRQSARGIICDLNPENALFFHFTLKILRESHNKDDFIRKMSDFLSTHDLDSAHMLNPASDPTLSLQFCPNIAMPNRFIGSQGLSIAELRWHSTVKNGWLGNDAQFAHIKHLADTDRITVITEDIRATATFTRIRNLLRDNDVPIDTLYVSNISEYMAKNDSDSDFFLNTIEALSEPDTLIIDARKNHSYLQFQFTVLSQKVTLKKDFQDSLEKRQQWWFGKETSTDFETRQKAGLAFFPTFAQAAAMAADRGMSSTTATPP